MAAPPTEREDPETALRLYALAVEMADRLSARRAGANSFFLALQTGLAALLGIFAVRAAPNAATDPDRFALTLAALAGLVLALAWLLLLRSYRKLSSAKWSVITSIEQSYFKLRPFAQEWTALTASNDPVVKWYRHVTRFRDRYTELGMIERVVPLLFMGIYAALALHLR